MEYILNIRKIIEGRALPMLGFFRKSKEIREMTDYTESLDIDTGFAPQNVYLRVSECSRSVGDRVCVGDTLGLGADKSSVSSGISGKIAEITPLENGVFEIRVENDFLSAKGSEIIPFGKRSSLKVTEITAEDVVSEISRAGISTRLRSISGSKRSLSERIIQAYGKAKQIVVSCASSEPCDGATPLIVSEYASDIINGMKILMSALKIGEGVIVLDVGDERLAHFFEEHIKDTDNIKILLAHLKYPADNEHLIIHALTSIEISAYKNAERVACAVFDGREALSVARAFICGEKETGDTVTVSGDVSEPINAYIPYGTKFSEIISYCGKGVGENTLTVAGGLLRGKIVSDEDIFCGQVSTVNVLNEESIPVFDGERCIKCGECVSVCPMMLYPAYLWQAKNLSAAKRFDVSACIECGACQYVCPERIPILDNIKKFKSTEGEK